MLFLQRWIFLTESWFHVLFPSCLIFNGEIGSQSAFQSVGIFEFKMFVWNVLIDWRGYLESTREQNHPLYLDPSRFWRCINFLPSFWWPNFYYDSCFVRVWICGFKCYQKQIDHLACIPKFPTKLGMWQFSCWFIFWGLSMCKGMFGKSCMVRDRAFSMWHVCWFDLCSIEGKVFSGAWRSSYRCPDGSLHPCTLGKQMFSSGYIKLIKPVIHFPLEGIYQFSVLVTSSPF